MLQAGLLYCPPAFIPAAVRWHGRAYRGFPRRRLCPDINRELPGSPGPQHRALLLIPQGFGNVGSPFQCEDLPPHPLAPGQERLGRAAMEEGSVQSVGRETTPRQ